jgi:hypothetical protein
MSKYFSRKITNADGVFDSKREYERWKELRFMETAGKIANLQRQVVYELIPAQYAPSTGKKRGKLLEHPCRYKADFVYTENEQPVVEDCKGYRTPEYRIKRKLMLWVHGIRVRET